MDGEATQMNWWFYAWKDIVLEAIKFAENSLYMQPNRVMYENYFLMTQTPYVEYYYYYSRIKTEKVVKTFFHTKLPFNLNHHHIKHMKYYSIKA